MDVMVERVPALVFGAHAAVAGFFGLVGVAGLLGGAEPGAAAVRLLVAVLVLALGVVVTGIVGDR